MSCCSCLALSLLLYLATFNERHFSPNSFVLVQRSRALHSQCRHSYPALHSHQTQHQRDRIAGNVMLRSSHLHDRQRWRCSVALRSTILKGVGQATEKICKNSHAGRNDHPVINNSYCSWSICKFKGAAEMCLSEIKDRQEVWRERMLSSYAQEKPYEREAGKDSDDSRKG